MPEMRLIMCGFEHEPGGAAAVAEGCTCSPALNRWGAGSTRANGRSRYVCEKACPLHGFDAMLRAIRAGRARRIREAEEARSGFDEQAVA
jgi:hypothetical protein